MSLRTFVPSSITTYDQSEGGNVVSQWLTLLIDTQLHIHPAVDLMAGAKPFR